MEELALGAAAGGQEAVRRATLLWVVEKQGVENGRDIPPWRELRFSAAISGLGYAGGEGCRAECRDSPCGLCWLL